MSDPAADVNFYELLDIDPSKRLSADEAKQLIKSAKARWNKESNSPSMGGSKARLKREKLRRLTDGWTFDTLSDPELERHLEEHRQARKRERDKKRSAAYEQLKEEIEFVALKGYILQREIDALVAAHSEMIPREQVESLASRYRRDEATQEQVSRDTLDRIDGLLDSIGAQSLCDVVGVALDASDTDIFEAAQRLYSDASRHRGEEWTIRKDLSGEAKSIFQSLAQAHSYREHERQRRFDRAFLTPVATTCNVTHKITAAQARLLLERAEKDQWSRDEATELLVSVASERGWSIILPSATAEQRGRIQELQRLMATRDSEVRTVREQLSQQRAAKIQIEERLRAAEKRATIAEQAAQLNKELSADALQQLRQAQERARKARAELDELNRRLADKELELVRELGPSLSMHLAHAELVAAQSIILSFPTLPPQWGDDARRVEQGIAESRRLLAMAQAAAGDAGRAETLVDQALGVCSDLQEARDLKATLRPAPPVGLEASLESDTIALTWKPSPSREVRYVVVRAEGKRPLQISDGVRLATVADCHWRDEIAPAARQLWYAIFAERGTTVSAQAAIADSALTFLPDALDVRAEGRDTMVALHWRLPRDARSVLVVRNEVRPPASPEDGQSFALGQTTHFEDTELVNGGRVNYRIYCEYVGAGDELLRSRGVATSAAPGVLAIDMPSLTLRGIDGINNHTVIIETREPEHGSLVIYRATTTPSISAGRSVPIARHRDFFGADWHEVRDLRDTLLQPGTYFYTPVVLFEQTAYSGEPEVYHYLPPVRNLRAVDHHQAGLQARWTWPPRCDTAEVRCVETGDGGSQVIIAHVRRVGSAEGGFAFHDLPGGEYKIIVLARYLVAGQPVCSSEESVPAQHVVPAQVRYALHIHRVALGRSRRVLEMHANQPVRLPRIRVVYGREPLASSGGGQILCEYSPGSSSPDSTWTVPLPDFTPVPDARIFVFPVDAALAVNVTFEFAPSDDAPATPTM